MTGAGVWGERSGFLRSSEPKDRLPWRSTPQPQAGSSAGRTLLRPTASAQEARRLWLQAGSRLVGFLLGRRGPRRGADSHSGTNSHSPLDPPDPPTGCLSAPPSPLHPRCLSAGLGGQAKLSQSQDLTLPLCCPGLAPNF